MTRVFVAVRLPDVVLDAVATRASGLAVPGRTTTRDQWHLTLQFLGDHADVDAVSAALQDLGAAGGRARVGGAGAFPDARRARVLWLGLIEGTDVLARLAAAVAQRMAPLGHEPETRPFRPHLTLARCRVPADLRDAVSVLGGEPVGPAWVVDAVTVYESRLEPGGARYIARATITL